VDGSKNYNLHVKILFKKLYFLLTEKKEERFAKTCNGLGYTEKGTEPFLRLRKFRLRKVS